MLARRFVGLVVAALWLGACASVLGIDERELRPPVEAGAGAGGAGPGGSSGSGHDAGPPDGAGGAGGGPPEDCEARYGSEPCGACFCANCVAPASSLADACLRDADCREALRCTSTTSACCGTIEDCASSCAPATLGPAPMTELLSCVDQFDCPCGVGSMCGCAMNGQACTAQTVCCSGYCSPMTSQCAQSGCKPNGDPCIGPADCCSSHCGTDARCADKPPCAQIGASCLVHGDCCGGFCAPHQKCEAMLCKANGATCAVATECCSSYCGAAGTCVQAPADGGAAWHGMCRTSCTLVASGESQPWGVAITGAGVFWSTRSGGAIRGSLGGSTPQTLAAAEPVPEALVAAGDALYWLAGNGRRMVRRMTSPTAPAETAWMSPAELRGIASDGSRVFVVSDAGAVTEVTAAPVTIFVGSGTFVGEGLASENGIVWSPDGAATPNSAQLRATQAVGAMPTSVVSLSMAPPRGLAGDGAYLAWTADDGVVWYATLPMGPPTAITGAQSSPRGIVTSGGAFYWVTEGDGSLRSGAPGGGMPITHAGGFTMPRHLAADAAAVYVADPGGGFVVRVAK